MKIIVSIKNQDTLFFQNVCNNSNGHKHLLAAMGRKILIVLYLEPKDEALWNIRREVRKNLKW